MSTLSRKTRSQSINPRRSSRIATSNKAPSQVSGIKRSSSVTPDSSSNNLSTTGKKRKTNAVKKVAVKVNSSAKPTTVGKKKTSAKALRTSPSPPICSTKKKQTTKATHPVDKDIPSYYYNHPISSFYVIQNEKSGLWYDAVLNQCNIMNGNNNNKYYRIQMLKKNDQDSYYVWLKWGRVGEPSTGRDLKGPFSSEEAAIPTY